MFSMRRTGNPEFVMTSARQPPLYTSVAALLMLVGMSSAYAAHPESGLYWNPINNGTGYTIEVQGDRVAMVIYSFSTSGDPEVFVGAGQLVEGGTVEPSTYTQGLLPSHTVAGTLHRPTNGNRLGNFNTTAPGIPLMQSVGNFRLTFTYHSSAFLELALTDAGGGPSFTTTFLIRSNYGYGSLGTHPTDAGFTCFPDYRGQWVFVEQSDLARPAWRFNFTEAVVDPLGPFTCADSAKVTFVDPARSARMECQIQRPIEPGAGVERYGGCEVIQNGQVLFNSNYNDLGLERFLGSLGPLPLSNSGILRTSQQVIGVRVK
jgi:hypothetical protein